MELYARGMADFRSKNANTKTLRNFKMEGNQDPVREYDKYTEILSRQQEVLKQEQNVIKDLQADLFKIPKRDTEVRTAKILEIQTKQDAIDEILNLIKQVTEKRRAVQRENELDVNLNPQLRDMSVEQIFERFATMAPIQQAQAMVI